MLFSPLYHIGWHSQSISANCHLPLEILLKPSELCPTTDYMNAILANSTHVKPPLAYKTKLYNSVLWAP